MPFVSDDQRRFFQMCKHQPKHARGDCPPAEVVKEFLSGETRTENMVKKARRAAVSDKAGQRAG